MRFYAAAEHIRSGQSLRDAGNIQESLAEFRMAAEIDPTNFEALGELRRTADMIQRQAQEKENAAKKSNAPMSSIEREPMVATECDQARRYRPVICSRDSSAVAHKTALGSESEK